VTEDTSAAVNQPDNLADLRPKMRLRGTVSSVELFGVLVDVGVGRDGLLHISELNEKKGKAADETFSVGQAVTVWVKQVEKKANRVTLTLQEPLAVEWHELRPGQIRSGKVVRLEKFGAFVDIGAERPGMVHVREITTGRVVHPDEVVTLGEEVEAQVIAVNRKKRQIDMSMRALEKEAVAEGEDETPPPTAMELALRAAMQGKSGMERSAQKKRKKKRGNAREELLRRTLANRRDE
tara:strand:- start:533 stop:1243 length:711 start_codon:yes stop_codon:yes gene_type:complete